jgi:hypothetical protein
MPLRSPHNRPQPRLQAKSEAPPTTTRPAGAEIVSDVPRPLFRHRVMRPHGGVSMINFLGA